MKHLLKVRVLLALFFLLSSAHAERLQMNIDAGWMFQLGDQNLAQAVEFDDSEWRSLDVPHDWAIESAFSKTNAHQNAWLPGGIGWYRKEFTLEAGLEGQRVELQFDGVYKHAQVWVNGEMVGSQNDGYTSFYFDITPQFRFGSSNTIAVRVDNSVQPNCRWYTGAGIYRHVWLTVTDPLHLETWGTAITTPMVTESEALVRVVTSIKNLRADWAKLVLETDIYNSEGEKVGTATSSQQVSPKQSADLEQTVSVFSPDLWSVDTPELYTAVSRLMVGKDVVDETRSTFGIRDIRFDAEKGFFLNGENMKMKGVCLHAEAGTFGSAVPVEVWERRLARLKEAGCNAIRTAHNPMAPEFMDLCDRMGFLVMDEFVDKWDHSEFADPHFRAEWKHNFDNNIRRDRNHPSVVIWSVGNENHAPGSIEQTESIERYCNFVRSIDSTRPVVSGMERGLDYDPAKKVDDILESCEHMDLIGMNYGLQWSKRIALRKPGKAFVATESLPYFSSSEEVRWSHTERHNWFDVLENDSNIGMFIWSGITYLGEIPAKGPDSWPNVFCWPSSILDSAGLRTDISYFYESLWTDEPVVSIAVYEKDAVYQKKWGSPPTKASWNHQDGEAVDLVTYTNCDYVELYLNDRKIGTQKLSDFSNWVVKWHEIAYESGTLKAVGIRDGKAVCEFELKTAGEPAGVQLNSEVLGDLVFVEAQLVDADGKPVCHEERELQFSVEGGDILSLDNGNLNALLKMQERNLRPTSNGRCLAILRSGDGVTPMKLTVSAKGFPIESKVLDPSSR